jgi:hypothetical protein
LSPQEEEALVRSSCGFDVRRFCRAVKIGEGRIIRCLTAMGPDLSTGCAAALKVIGPR